jgi:3'(2'), 5'-bisphosphate nucleotidase
MTTEQYLTRAILASIAAGKAILDVYHSDFSVAQKDDRSPLTLADRRSHEIIEKMLQPFNVPILSEEGKTIPYEKRKAWRRIWIVDPLDGTKEFISRNGEFTVNIALVSNGRPILGVVYIPVNGILYFAANKRRAYKMDAGAVSDLLTGGDGLPDMSGLLKKIMGASSKLPLKQRENRPLTIVGSRSHATPALEAFVEKMRREHGEVQFISAGSSLKICLVAEGSADYYPRLGPTMEWDTAAGQVIAENAAAQVLCFDTGAPLSYNKENLLNPWFIVKR